MSIVSAIRYGLPAIALAALPLTLAATGPPVPADRTPDGKIGFIVTYLNFGLSNSNNPAAICPRGLTIGPRDIFAATPEGHRHDGEADADYSRRLQRGAALVQTAANGQNVCMNPKASTPDPNHRIVTGNVRVYGLDLDGQVSRVNGRAASGTCAHDDFTGVDGARGVDNQLFRAVGCTNTFAPGGQMNDIGEQSLSGDAGVLIQLEDVQDLRNDADVVVHLYASADPIELSPNRVPLEHATYAYSPNPRYRATTHGRITNGVLTTDPVDTRFDYFVNAMRLERVLQDTRLRMTISADGKMDGYMAGYTPFEDAYDQIFGFRTGQNRDGSLARQRQGSSNGFAFVARHTCNGVYYALKQMADGHRDPTTGRCTSLSTQYRVRAIPAFVIAPAGGDQAPLPPPTPAPPTTRLSVNSTLGQLLDNPAARAILERQIPQLLSNPDFDQARDYTLQQVGEYAHLSAAKLSAIDADLAMLPAR